MQFPEQCCFHVYLVAGIFLSIFVDCRRFDASEAEEVIEYNKIYIFEFVASWIH